MNIIELRKKYGNEAKCIRHLEKVKWNGRPICAFCSSTNLTKRQTGKGRYHCNTCNKDFSVLHGTIFEGSKLPLNTWFLIVSLMLNAKSGVSAKEIERQVGITYKSAWYACMRIRTAMIEHNELFTGIVEMDEGYVGGKPRHITTTLPDNVPSISHIDEQQVKNKRGRGTKKIPVVGIVSRGKEGKVATQVSKRLTSKNLLEILKKNVDTNEAMLVTDDFKSYKKFSEHINHIIAAHEKQTGAAHTKNIDNFFSIIKNGIKGSYKAISPKYLPLYLTEYGYKYNKRNIPDDFKETIEGSVETKRSFKNYKPKSPVDTIVYGEKKKKKKTEVKTTIKSKKTTMKKSSKTLKFYLKNIQNR